MKFNIFIIISELILLKNYSIYIPEPASNPVYFLIAGIQRLKNGAELSVCYKGRIYVNF